MALNKPALVAALTLAFTPSEGSSPASAANAIADAIDLYVKTATVNPLGLSNAGGPVVGVGSLF